MAALIGITSVPSCFFLDHEVTSACRRWILNKETTSDFILTNITVESSVCNV